MSLSPGSSPRSSPRPSPRLPDKRDHSKSDTYLTVGYKENSWFPKHEGSPSSVDSAGSNRGSNVEVSNSDVTRTDGNTPVTKEKKEPRSKKKTSWFNSFYPTYKSRSEDFKRLFKDLPDDERLVVDYSCALQKEILVQGRLYITQNFLCFYANIFGWETNVTVKWKEVSAITKEKTALVIPNAILICTRSEKYFFTTFAARDKTYLMLFRVWQNALLDQPMSAPEMWQWVHQSYGDKLGLTSDDEDYVAPGTEEDKLSAKLSVESFSEQECPSNVDFIMDPVTAELASNKDLSEMLTPDAMKVKPSQISKSPSDAQMPTDMSDTTDSDIEKSPTVDVNVDIQCTSNHEGRLLMNEVMPIHIDQLFTLLFTSSKFYLDFHASRKTTDLTQTPWTHNTTSNTKRRIVNLTVPLTQPVGPKTSQVTETQVMLPCSKAGHLYAIDIETVNAGIPYADSFYVVFHYCIRKISETETSISVHAQIKYRKSVWGLVKGMIEKNCWYGLEDFFTALNKALHAEVEDIPCVKRRSRRKKRTLSMPRPYSDEVPIKTSLIRTKSSVGFFSSETATLIVLVVLVLLVVLNIMLYYKLWSLEDSPHTIIDLQMLKNPPSSHDEWIKLLQQQETLHAVEMQKWQKTLKTAIKLLEQTEDSLNELQRSIHPTYVEKVSQAAENSKEPPIHVSNVENTEL